MNRLSLSRQRVYLLLKQGKLKRNRNAAELDIYLSSIMAYEAKRAEYRKTLLNPWPIHRNKGASR